jgi:2-phospho-L-lactate guanylyltransferase
MTWALLPLKSFASAKQRLSAILSGAERQGLFAAMVKDVLMVLSNHPQLSRVWIVSDDPDARQLCQQFGIDFIPESSLGVSGLNPVVIAAAAFLEAKGAGELLIIHGDLPLVDADAISAILDTARSLASAGVVVAPDIHGTGTNCLWVSPATAIGFAYGENSCQHHKLLAAKAGLPFAELNATGLSRDIDTPEDFLDLVAVASNRPNSHTFRYLCDSGLGQRIAELNTANLNGKIFSGSRHEYV